MYMHGENEVINFFRSEEAKYNKELSGRSRFLVFFFCFFFFRSEEAECNKELRVRSRFLV